MQHIDVSKLESVKKRKFGRSSCDNFFRTLKIRKMRILELWSVRSSQRPWPPRISRRILTPTIEAAPAIAINGGVMTVMVNLCSRHGGRGGRAGWSGRSWAAASGRKLGAHVSSLRRAVGAQ